MTKKIKEDVAVLIKEDVKVVVEDVKVEDVPLTKQYTCHTATTAFIAKRDFGQIKVGQVLELNDNEATVLARFIS